MVNFTTASSTISQSHKWNLNRGHANGFQKGAMPVDADQKNLCLDGVSWDRQKNGHKEVFNQGMMSWPGFHGRQPKILSPGDNVIQSSPSL